MHILSLALLLLGLLDLFAVSHYVISTSKNPNTIEKRQYATVERSMTIRKSTPTLHREDFSSHGLQKRARRKKKNTKTRNKKPKTGDSDILNAIRNLQIPKKARGKDLPLEKPPKKDYCTGNGSGGAAKPRVAKARPKAPPARLVRRAPNYYAWPRSFWEQCTLLYILKVVDVASQLTILQTSKG